MPRHLPLLALAVTALLSSSSSTSSSFSSTSSSSCSSNLDCTLNGVCNNDTHTCLCDSGWGGANCSSLKLGVTDPSLGHPWDSGSSSWGGLPVFDPVGKLWHLFYSQIDRGCGLGAWSTNSRVVHAVSNDPLGPFSDVNVVEPAFSHNTQAFRTSDGIWVVFYIGCGQGEKITNCTASPADTLPLAPRTVPPGKPGENPSVLCTPQPFGALGEMYITYSSAPTPDGPWTPLGVPAITGTFNTSTWYPWMTNPAPWLMSDGSVLLAISADGGTSRKCIGFARADSWNSTYTIETNGMNTSETIAPIPDGEDPFVWVNTRGDRHCIWHDTSGRSNGGLAAAPAASPMSWTVVTNELYNGTIMFPNGTVGVANDRERPKLLFDTSEGEVVMLGLFNGMIPPNISGNGPCFTAVTRVDL